MYSFKRASVGPLTVHVSYPRQGATHLKQFAQETTPHTQGTFNIYVQGQFRFTVDGVVDQVLTPGQTTLDINATFPAHSLAVEEALSPFGVRYCVSGSTSKQVVDVTGPVDAGGNVVFVLDGQITFNGRTMTRGAYLFVPSGEIGGQGRVAFLA